LFSFFWVIIFNLIPLPTAASSAGCTLTPARSVPKHDRQHSRRGAPSSPGGPRYTTGRWPEAAPALGSSPLLTHGFDAPWAFRGPTPPNSWALQWVAPPRGPHGRLGRGRRSPTSPYPPWRPAVFPFPGPLDPEKMRRPGGCRFGRGNGHGSHRELKLSPPDLGLGICPSGSGGWQQWGTSGGEIPPYGHPTATSSVAPIRARNTSEWPGATQADSPGNPGCPDISGLKLSARRLSYLPRILEPRSRPFARRWRPSPLWDAASPPRQGDAQLWTTPRRRVDRHPHPPNWESGRPHARTHAPKGRCTQIQGPPSPHPPSRLVAGATGTPIREHPSPCTEGE